MSTPHEPPAQAAEAPARQYPDFMIDLETLGIETDSVVSTLGAVAFDAVGEGLGPTLSIRLDLDDQVQRGLRISPSTVVWWLKQSEEARADMASEEGRLSIADAMAELAVWYDSLATYDARVWAKSPSFDLSKIRHLCQLVGRGTPWHFAAEDDVRTIMRRTGTDLVRSPRAGHVALGDAIDQAVTVQNSCRKIVALLTPSAIESDIPLEEAPTTVEVGGNATFYCYKQSGKYYTEGRGTLPDGVDAPGLDNNSRRLLILAANQYIWPGLSTNGSDMRVIIVPDGPPSDAVPILLEPLVRYR